jgi:hypothetical protein
MLGLRYIFPLIISICWIKASLNTEKVASLKSFSINMTSLTGKKINLYLEGHRLAIFEYVIKGWRP